MNRRQSLRGISLICIAMLGGCNIVKAMTEKPTIRLRLDAPVSEVQAHSTYKFPQEFMQGIPGKEFITVPHVLIYHDDTLKLRFEDAGGLRTLATNISYSIQHGPTDLESIVQHFSVHPLPDYATLPIALERARKLRDELLAQGFIIEERSWRNRFDATSKAAPRHLDAFEDLEPAFLDSAFYVKSATVFAMNKNHLNIKLSLVNGRRKWGSRTDKTDSMTMLVEERAAKEAQTMSRQDLLSEPSYSLELSVGPTNEWMKKRGEAREAERKVKQSK